jgi:hypothetical protein
MLSLLVSCSSEKDAKPNSAAAPATQITAAPEAPAPVTSLSGEYVLTDSNTRKKKWGKQEYTCQITHTYTLLFIDGQTVRYTAKTDQSIDPPEEGVMCIEKLYNVNVTGAYEIKNGSSVTLTFSPSEEKMPWVHKNIMLLGLKDANTLAIVHNGSEFRKQ